MLEFFQNKLSKFGNSQLRDHVFFSFFLKRHFLLRCLNLFNYINDFFYMNIKREREKSQQLSKISSSVQLLGNQEIRC